MGLLKEQITEGCAWKADDLRSDASWLVHLSPGTLADIELALERLHAKRLRAAEFGREDFPVPEFADQADAIRDELEHGRGLVLIRGVPVEKYDIEDISRIFWGLGTYLGRGVPQRPVLNLGKFKDDLIAHITDQGYDYNAKNVHGSATSAEQAPHTDPADVVGLLCIRPAKSGGTSRIASSAAIHNEILATCPEFLEPLYRGFHFDLRGEVKDGINLEVTPNRVPIFSYYQDRLSCNFNAKMIETAQRKLGEPLTELEQAAVDYVVELASRPDIRFDMSFQPGDIQLLNNYTILHCRTGWEDYREPERKRLLLRLWLNVANGRELAPDFAGGYVLGSRHEDITLRPSA